MPDKLFTLRVPTSDGNVMIKAYDGGNSRYGGWRIDVEVKHKGKVIFPLGALYCGTPPAGGMSIDGLAAKELVMWLVGMKPGDTDKEYFESYTTHQIEWAQRFGEEISCERESRYCDENGNCRG